MKITENLHLENSGQYFRLVEKGIATSKKDGSTKEVDKNAREFGTVYQALNHIIESDYDVDKPLLDQFRQLLTCINDAKVEIKKNFRIEVKTS